MDQSTDDRALGGTQDVFYRRGSVVPLPMMERASGIYLWDEEGNKYIDAPSGPMVSAIKHGNQAIFGCSTNSRSKVVKQVEMLCLGVEPFQDGLSVFGNVGSLIVLPHEVLDAVEALEPHDRGELEFLVLDPVGPHQVCPY